MLGDNSPRARIAVCGTQARLRNYYVRRELLIGQALFIYWPHS